MLSDGLGAGRHFRMDSGVDRYHVENHLTVEDDIAPAKTWIDQPIENSHGLQRSPGSEPFSADTSSQQQQLHKSWQVLVYVHLWCHCERGS
jgi:hypothetical protein